MTSNNFASNLGPSEDQSKAVYQECVIETYKNRKTSLLAHTSISTLPFYLGWSTEANFSNILLIFILWSYTVFLYFVSKKVITKVTKEQDFRYWGNNAYYQLAVFGVLYNLIFFNLYEYGVDNSLLYLLIVTSFFSAGASSSFVHLKNLPVAFIFSSTLPQIIYYFSSHTGDGNIVAIFLVIFNLFMWKGSASIHRNMLKALNLSYKLNEANKLAEKLAMTDELTGINNRRAFFKKAKTLYYASQRYSHPLTVLMIDIDDFKIINDTYGHAAGDQVIQKVAESLQKNLRESDVVGRIGGEEFAISLPETDIDTAYILAERIRKKIKNITLIYQKFTLTFAVSIGCAESNDTSQAFEDLVGLADKVLYEAKNEGKNKTVIYSAN